MSDTFTATELAGMKTAQESHMMDECVLRVYSGTRDSYGQINASYADGVTTKCGFDATGGEIRNTAEKTVTRYDAKLRLPITTTLSLRDRIKITKRFGTAITSQEYDIVSPLMVGPSGIELYLREVVA